MAKGTVNKIFLLGRLGRDPQMRHTTAGVAVCTFSLATNEVIGKGEQKREETDWHNIVVYGKTGEIAEKYLNKGKQCFIEGRIRNRSYEKDGQTKYITEVIANSLELIGGKGSPQKEGSPPEDDLPF